MRFTRTLLLLGVAAAYFALGPWALLAAILLLLVPRVRHELRPNRKQLLVLVGVIASTAAAIVVIPDGRLPIPPGGGLLVTPSYVGSPATPHPIDLAIPQHPGLAPNGTSSMHNDGWASDAYPGPGPLGNDPEVDSSWYGIKECATLAFDSRERMIALCGAVSGPVMHIVDPDSMDPVDTLGLPGRTGNTGKKPWEDLCGGAYFYLDNQDTAFVGTTVRTIAVVSTSGAGGYPKLTIERTIDLAGAVPKDDCVIALMPDWEGNGTWFVSRHGRVGHAGTSGPPTVLDLKEDISNSISVDKGGLYVVTDGAFYKLAIDAGRPKVLWRTVYRNSGIDKSGQLSPGSGTTPTVLPSGLVAITDNAEPRMNVQFYRAKDGSLVCEVPVFGKRESSTDNSLTAVGDASVIVENNYGNDNPLSAALGRDFPGGFARVDAVPSAGSRECKVAWTNDEIGPSTVPKVSLANGLVYSYTVRPNRWGVAAWYVTAMSAATGKSEFSVRTGTGTMFNNHGAPVTLAPDGSLYVPTLTGMVRVRDSS
ncbi:hypothetical protein J2X11_002721 [Aeromicrobium panaciterrae]|uniref:PQQ-binding-like beta-propeller repeat protein n=1 Tax=Aeromicrobium panaciterrae TaxID=363861 RepID=A0ABU1URS2_9ACTN|nr:hypothetical protein [Aeromicrobium panaciterrae]MDR7087882.1 hypothetical protein [Aeromicrobium panaciterrae]